MTLHCVRLRAQFADVFSRRKTWATGLVVFVLGSALCGAAPSLAALIAFRGLQGVGSAMIMAVSPAMLLAAFPGEQRGRVLGLNAVVVRSSSASIPTPRQRHHAVPRLAMDLLQ